MFSTLADVAMYYYNTDLRDNSLGNCTGALGTSVCEDNVFVSGSDNNLKQHMTTFTLGLGEAMNGPAWAPPSQAASKSSPTGEIA